VTESHSCQWTESAPTPNELGRSGGEVGGKGEVIDPRLWYSTREVAALLGVNESTVRNWLAVGKLSGKSSGRGRPWRFRGSSLLAIQRASFRVLDPATPHAEPVPATLPDRMKPKGPQGSKAGGEGTEGK
jgi:excisionase family DNA binding protein